MASRFDLSGKVALVTGSTRGLGLAMATALAEQGAHVVINGRDDQATAARARELAARGLATSAEAFDVADGEACKAAVARVAAARGRLDVLVNNAGIVHREELTRFADEDWQRVVDVNLRACFLLAREAAKSMLRQRWGRIINIGSVMSVIARPNIVAYVSTKHAVAGLTKALAAELGPRGITANAIAPGYFGTDLNTALMQDPEFDAMVRNRTPAGRWGEPEELGHAAVFLASDEAAYVNGVVMAVDGGMTVSL